MPEGPSKHPRSAHTLWVLHAKKTCNGTLLVIALPANG